MYHAHSKDINRNKSFHPLTYANLRRVEQLKEQQAEQQRARDARAKELRRDQEERRYDELILGAATPVASDGATTAASVQLAHFRQVKNVFAAEYATSTSRRRTDDSVDVARSGNSNNDDNNKHKDEDDKGNTAAAPSRALPPAMALQYNLADKFHKDSDTSLKAEYAPSTSAQTTHASARDDGSSGSAPSTLTRTHAGAKRERDDADTLASSAPAQTTGYVSSSEAARLRKELDLVKKQRLDPLRRVQQFHNSTVVAAARAQEQQQQQQRQRQRQQQSSSSHATVRDDTQASLKEHIRRMLDL